MSGQPFAVPDVRVQEIGRCSHPHARLTYKDARNGVRHWRDQCTTCGIMTRVVKKAEVSESMATGAMPFDEALQSSWWRRAWRERKLSADQERRDEQARWWNWYSGYLKTAEWARRRTLVLDRSRGSCEGCGVARASQVHHLTYARVGKELLFDLVAVCQPCHQLAHPNKDITL